MLRKSDLTNQFRNITGALAIDGTPEKIIQSIQPTLEMSKKYADFVASAKTTTTGSATIYLTPTDKDFYLTSIRWGFVKDVTSDGTEIYVTFIVGGKTVYYYGYAPPTTVSSDEWVINFNYPIKIDRNTSIAYTGAFTAGTQTRFATITGFYS